MTPRPPPTVLGLMQVLIKKHKKPNIVKLTRYNTRIKVFVSKRKLKGTGVSITESLTTKRIDQLNKAREEHGFTNEWTTDGRIHLKPPNENKSNLFYD